MIDIYGLDETGGAWRQKAATLAADVVAQHAVDVDANARFPVESIALHEAVENQRFFEGSAP